MQSHTGSCHRSANLFVVPSTLTSNIALDLRGGSFISGATLWSNTAGVDAAVPKVGVSFSEGNFHFSGRAVVTAPIKTNPNALQSVSYEAWVKIASITKGVHGYIVSQYPDYGYSRALVVTDTRSGNAGGPAITPPRSWGHKPVTPSEWIHLVGCWTQGGMSNVYVNGVMGMEQSVSTGAGNSDAEVLIIGGHSTGSTLNHKDSYISSVRVYSERLSDAQVALLRNEYMLSLATTVSIPLKPARYVRLWSAKSNLDNEVRFSEIAVHGVSLPISDERKLGITNLSVSIARVTNQFILDHGLADQYAYSEKPGTFEEKHQDCAALGRGLVSIHSDTENAVVNRLAASGGDATMIWIGFAQGKWQDGSAVGLSKWASSTPTNEQCGAMAITNDRFSGTWTAATCTTSKPALCGHYTSAAELSELALFDTDGEPIVPLQSSVPSVTDGALNTSWVANLQRQPTITLDLGREVPIGSYSFATADATTSANPMARDLSTWRISGSHDEVNWEVIDDSFAVDGWWPGDERWKENQNRRAFAGPFPVPVATALPDNHISFLPVHRIPKIYGSAQQAARWVFGEGPLPIVVSEYVYNVFRMTTTKVPLSGSWYTACDSDKVSFNEVLHHRPRS